MSKLTEKQSQLLRELAKKSPQQAWQLAEVMGSTALAISMVARPLMKSGHIGVVNSGYFLRVTATGASVQSIPDGEENERMVQEFIAKNGVTVIPRGMSAEPEPGGYFKRHRSARKKRTNGNAD